MIVTEQEAKTLWCPQRSRQRLNDSNCIGSQCMWWNWGLQPTPQRRLCHDETALVEPRRMAGLPGEWFFVPHDESEGSRAQWVEPQVSADARRKGCCGVAHT